MALNARQERFAQLIALGQLSQIEAWRQAGYSDKVAGKNILALLHKPLVASRIEKLRQLTSFRHDVTRDKVIAEVSKLALADPEPAVPTPSEKLKALAQLSQLLGYNEPEKRVHEHTHLNVDASLIAQLRAGYGELASVRAHEAKALCMSTQGLTGGGIPPTPPPPPALETGTPPPPPEEGEQK